jgi:hypothetical protein
MLQAFQDSIFTWDNMRKRNSWALLYALFYSEGKISQYFPCAQLLERCGALWVVLSHSQILRVLSLVKVKFQEL